MGDFVEEKGMDTVFIVNPCAGKGFDASVVLDAISLAARKTKCKVTTHITKACGEATEFVRGYCERFGAARFIACGGDGTLSEVLNGAIGCDGVEIGVMPMGTGNDFCRNFDEREAFDNIEKQISTGCKSCDVIKYTTCVDGEEKTGYCVNMFNIGFDASVVDTTARIKEKTFCRGSFAYFVSIFVTLIRKKCQNLTIELDGKVLHSGKLLLTSLANGSYCGGGIKSNPLASVCDGFININIIKNLSRTRFISLLPYYMKGTVLKLKRAGRFIVSKKCKRVTITPLSGKIRLCVDGELIDAEKTEFEIIPSAFNFVVPQEVLEPSVI